MIKRLTQGTTTTFFCIWLLVIAGHAEGEREYIAIAILPCSDVVMTFKKFHPLTMYLKEETGFEVRTFVPKDIAEFEMALKNGEMDFAFQDPYTYVRIADLFDKSSLMRALTREGEAFQYGVVIVRRDSNIKILQDLRGKTVMFGPDLSAPKWTAARELFGKNGIDIDRDLKAFSHGGCCEDIAFSVYLGAVDAGVVCDHFLTEHPEKQKDLGVEAKQMAVISRTEAVPMRLFTARKGINAGILKAVNQALLRLDKNNPAHAKILYSAEIGGFQKADARDYERIKMSDSKPKSE
jgi:ABC-type phosphate/phosphonate transport system substrate-binding protein